MAQVDHKWDHKTFKVRLSTSKFLNSRLETLLVRYLHRFSLGPHETRISMQNLQGNSLSKQR